MPDVILGGRQAIDGDTAQVGPQVAQKLGLPQVTYVEEILKCADGKMTVKRHIDGGVETVEAPLPLVLTVNGSAAPCRPRNAKLVMKYKRAMVPMEKPAEGLAYAEEYEKETLPDFGTVEYGRCGCRLEAVRPERFAHQGEGRAEHRVQGQGEQGADGFRCRRRGIDTGIIG